MASRKRRSSQEWFGREGKMGFIYRSWVKNRGIPHDQFDGRPVIGICNTYSELTPCNSHFRTLAEHVKTGVHRSGRLPARVPGDVARRDAAAAHGDALPQPRQHGRRGIDPRQSHRRRGAAHGLRQDHALAAHGRVRACDLPTIGVSGGPMLSGWYRGERIGSGTNTWSLSEDAARRADHARTSSTRPRAACTARTATA